MRSLFLVAAFCAFVISAEAQITNDRMNIVYRGIPNPMSFGVFGYSCKSVYITVDTGEIVMVDDPKDCGAIVYNAPAKGSMAIFRLFAKTKKGSEKIWESKFRIKDIPDPEASVLGKQNDTIRLAALKVQTGMIARQLNFDICSNYKIEGFNYAIIRNEKIIVNGKNVSAYFDENIKKHFATLEDNDRVLFYHIYYVGSDKELRKLNPIELRVIK
jgi:hypothetical protein